MQLAALMPEYRGTEVFICKSSFLVICTNYVEQQCSETLLSMYKPESKYLKICLGNFWGKRKGINEKGMLLI